MMKTKKKYVISIDQSTQGTKALLFDAEGKILARRDRRHRQIVNNRGWISHDPEEVYANVIGVIRDVLTETKLDPAQVLTLGISNQRETSLIWDRRTGRPLADAVVWQCARAGQVCEREEIAGQADLIREHTGLPLSPYFPAAKIAWLLANTKGARELANEGLLCQGTMDSYLIYRLTGGRSYVTDYSNASRTQLFHIRDLQWDRQICTIFGIDPVNLPRVMDSDSCFGYTDCEGIFPEEIPINSVMGDSHAALFGQNCRSRGRVKATYGTGSSIMMHIGDKPIRSAHGLVTSLAWGIGGEVSYVLEGNLNYTGAVISWLKDDLKMIDSPAETEELAGQACQEDSLYLIPAFSGLGAPYWKDQARAAIWGMDRRTGRKEVVRAGLDCIAYQICDVVRAMEADLGSRIQELRVDGGPTKNAYLMQFQSDILSARVQVSQAEELSAIGAAYLAGLASGLWDERVFEQISYQSYRAQMDSGRAEAKYAGWIEAIRHL